MKSTQTCVQRNTKSTRESQNSGHGEPPKPSGVGRVRVSRRRGSEKASEVTFSRRKWSYIINRRAKRVRVRVERCPLRVPGNLLGYKNSFRGSEG